MPARRLRHAAAAAGDCRSPQRQHRSALRHHHPGRSRQASERAPAQQRCSLCRRLHKFRPLERGQGPRFCQALILASRLAKAVHHNTAIRVGRTRTRSPGRKRPPLCGRTGAQGPGGEAADSEQGADGADIARQHTWPAYAHACGFVRTIAWLHCLGALPGPRTVTEGSWRCVDNGDTAGAASDGELEPRAAEGIAGGGTQAHPPVDGDRRRHARCVQGRGPGTGASSAPRLPRA